MLIQLVMAAIPNKCIGDDTKAAVRQSLNCIKTKNKIWQKRFSICRMEFLHSAMWHDHDIDFARWLHPAMWYVALGWHAIEFAVTSAIGILHLVSISTTSPQSTCHSAPDSEILSKLVEKNDVMSIFKMVDLSHLGF